MADSPVVIITGAARGIGYGIAECFAKTGAALVIADLNLETATASAKTLVEAGARDAIGLTCNVADRASVEAMVAAALAHFGRVDVLVNNAGICPFQNIMDMSPETWQKTLDVNTTGGFHCTQTVARHMIERGGGGRVIFITSLAENVTGPSQVDYAASKAGARMTAVGFATALGRYGITVNAIAPGMILTDMTRHHWEKPGPSEQIKSRVPMGRIGTPTDIGNVAVFLASPEAEYVSGITVRVDGGHQAVCS